jgi:hypothetical protein
MTQLWLLLAEDTSPEPNDVTAGWTGLIVLVLIGLATAFLLRSMNRRLKGVDFDEDETERRPRQDPTRHGEPDEDA